MWETILHAPGPESSYLSIYPGDKHLLLSETASGIRHLEKRNSYVSPQSSGKRLKLVNPCKMCQELHLGIQRRASTGGLPGC